jgi:hypothetical protein
MKKMAVAFMAFILSGCVSVRPVPTASQAFDSYHDAPLTIATYKTPDFAATTYGAAMFGVVGALSMIEKGNEIIRDNEVPDPALTIAAKLTPAVSGKFKTSGGTTVPGLDTKSDNEKALATLAQSKGLILDVETINWSFVYFPLDWTHYRIIYVARARLIDAHTQQRLAQAPCEYKSDEKESPDYDMMLANRADILKQMFARAGDQCAETMRKMLLGG